jgi:hypothetical protein
MKAFHKAFKSPLEGVEHIHMSFKTCWVPGVGPLTIYSIDEYTLGILFHYCYKDVEEMIFFKERKPNQRFSIVAIKILIMIYSWISPISTWKLSERSIVTLSKALVLMFEGKGAGFWKFPSDVIQVFKCLN